MGKSTEDLEKSFQYIENKFHEQSKDCFIVLVEMKDMAGEWMEWAVLKGVDRSDITIKDFIDFVNPVNPLCKVTISIGSNEFIVPSMRHEDYYRNKLEDFVKHVWKHVRKSC